MNARLVATTAIHLATVTRSQAVIISEGIRLKGNKLALKSELAKEVKKIEADKHMAKEDLLESVWSRVQDALRFKDR